MNEREKKLIFILFGAAFIIVNLFLFSSFSKGMKKKEILIKNNTEEIALKDKMILEADERLDEETWLRENQPQEGIHSDVSAELATFVEQSARKHSINSKKRPILIPENLENAGRFSTAVVKIAVNAKDQELINWISELQSPQQSRSVTLLRIVPDRNDPERIDCELEVTTWFIPATEDDLEEITSN